MCKNMCMRNIMKIEIGADNPILRKKSLPVKGADNVFLRAMKDTMLQYEGLGLAAPQVGVNERVFVMRLLRDNLQNETDETTAEESKPINYTILECVNPEIISMSEDMLIGEEGCLSLPKIYKDVPRAREITVKFDDAKGKQNILTLENMNARIFQHEYDHLDGILFIDRTED